MNIKLFFLLIIVIISINLYESYIISKELYDSKLLKELKKLDKELNKICIKNEAIKGYEFSMKLSLNKVENIRYAYGITGKMPNDNPLDENIINEINLSKEFRNLTFDYLKNTKSKLKSIGFSEDRDIGANRVYFEILNEKSKEVPTIASYEKINNKLYFREYNYDYLDEYLENQMNKCGKFGKIINKYIPNYKFRDDGYKFKSDKIDNIESIRITLEGYYTVSDLSNMIFELADYFKIKDLIKIKKWIHFFKDHEVNVLGITFSPKQNITFYTRELTDFINYTKYE